MPLAFAPLLEIEGIFARNRELVNDEIGIQSGQAIGEMQRLARQYGLLCGPSSGAHLLAARQIQKQHPELKTIVTIFDDEGEKYLQDFFKPQQPEKTAAVPFH